MQRQLLNRFFFIASGALLVFLPTACTVASAPEWQNVTATPSAIPPTPTTTPVRVEQPLPSITPAQTATAVPTPVPATHPTTTPTVDILTAIATLFATAAPASPTIPSVIQVNGREISLSPGNPLPYLSVFRLVSYYGHPAADELGVLGHGSREEMLGNLRVTTALYQALWPEYTVIPAIHFIGTIADSEPGEYGLYNRQTRLSLLHEWTELAQREGMAFILDIQPGRADLLSEFERIRPLLYHPHVHLALDPEFIMEPDQIPGRDLGHLDAGQINLVQAQINDVAATIGLHKLLIIHQFESGMVQDKEFIQNYPYVELIINADGFGKPETKVADYHQYAEEPGWEYGGIKLFYDWDVPLLTPEQVLQIMPQPVLVVYQ